MTPRLTVGPPERARAWPDGDDVLADAQSGGAAGAGRLQPRGVNLQNRHVRVEIASDKAALVSLAVVQGDHDGLGAFDHVIVGEDIAVVPDNDAGANARCRAELAGSEDSGIGRGHYLNDGRRKLAHDVHRGQSRVRPAAA